jgi:hypothetical protein
MVIVELHSGKNQVVIELHSFKKRVKMEKPWKLVTSRTCIVKTRYKYYESYVYERYGERIYLIALYILVCECHLDDADNYCHQKSTKESNLTG